MKVGTGLGAVLLACLLLASVLSGCGSGSTAAGSSEYEPVNLAMAVNGTDNQIDSLVANYFAELVLERSGGSVVVDVFPNDTLAGGNATKGIEYIAVGGSDLGAYATSVLSNLESKMSVATIPWSFTSYQQARQIIDTTGGEYSAKLLADKGITYLGSFHNGFRQLTNSKRPVTKPDDLKSLKIRVPGSAVSVFYGLAVDIFIYKEINVKKLIDILIDSCSTTATVMFITMGATLFAYVLTRARLDLTIKDFMLGVTNGNWIVFFIIVNIVLLIAGCFLDSTSALYIFTPLFAPVAAAMGIDPIHLGVVMIVNLAIGLFTPPVGVNLYVACRIGDIKIEEISKGIIPCLVAELIVLLLVTYIPAISTMFV